VYASVKVHTDPKVRAHGFANRAHAFQRGVDLRMAVDELHFGDRVHLHRGEPARPALLRHGRGVGRTISADPRIGADAIAKLATAKLMHRNAECPSLDVPERLIDSCEGAHVDSAAAVESSAVEDRPMFLDQKRVLPDEVITELLDSGGDGVRSSLEDRLSPSRSEERRVG